MKTTNHSTLPTGHSLLPGYKVFSLVLWKQAVELLKQQPKLSAFAIAGILGCTEKTAEGMITDYRKMKRRLQSTVNRRQAKKGAAKYKQ